MPNLKRKELLTDSNLLFIIAICIFVFLYLFAMIAIGGAFRTFQHFFNIISDNAALIILACGLSIVMVGGGIDISVGGVTAMITMACAVFLNSTGGNILVSMVMALGIGLAFGVVQGYLIAYLGIQPFIITLAGMFFARGMVTVISGNPVRVIQEDFVNLTKVKLVSQSEFLGRHASNGSFVPLSISICVIVVALLAVLAVVFILKWTRFGRNLYAVGGNNQSALMLGINVKRTKFFSYVLCGLLAGVAGYVYLLNTGSGTVSNATGFEMKAIAASIIGGTMLTGGVGNIIGSPVGVMTLMTIDSMVVLSGLTENRPYMQTITTGVVLCLAILLQSVVLARRGKGGFKLLPQRLKFKSR